MRLISAGSLVRAQSGPLSCLFQFRQRLLRLFRVFSIVLNLERLFVPFARPSLIVQLLGDVSEIVRHQTVSWINLVRFFKPLARFREVRSEERRVGKECRSRW